MARPFVNEIREHDRIRGIFKVQRKSLLQSRTGTSYLSITLSDRTGDIESRVWDDVERLDQLFDRGAYVEVNALAQSYQGRLQLKVEGLELVSRDEIDARDFQPSTRFDIDLMWRELRSMVDGVGDGFVRQLLNDFLDDPAIGPAFRTSPAAKGIHHPFVGGLLEHTLSVLQLAHRIADHYPRADRDLLVAGAVLHDIGKVRELSAENGIDYTTEGRLVGHLVLTLQWIHEKASRIPQFPRDLAMHLTHIVAAHHGQLEYGSPKVPQTLEAMLVHALDELDSRVQSWTMIMERDRGTEWTEYQKIYERFLFKGPGWGRERAGLPPAEPSAAWNGMSLYRREAVGLLSPVEDPAVVEVPARTGTEG
jgi:3'-5' exoribonuclease